VARTAPADPHDPENQKAEVRWRPWLRSVAAANMQLMLEYNPCTARSERHVLRLVTINLHASFHTEPAVRIISDLAHFPQAFVEYEVTAERASMVVHGANAPFESLRVKRLLVESGRYFLFLHQSN
jgi:hypothetical protein